MKMLHTGDLDARPGRDSTPLSSAPALEENEACLAALDEIPSVDRGDFAQSQASRVGRGLECVSVIAADHHIRALGCATKKRDASSLSRSFRSVPSANTRLGS
jgi:hypothetical protein